MGNFARETMLDEGVISPEDLELIHNASTPDEALQIIVSCGLGIRAEGGSGGVIPRQVSVSPRPGYLPMQSGSTPVP